MPFIARVIVSDGWSIEVISTVENNAEWVTTVLFRLYGRVFVSLGNNNERCYLLLVITVRSPAPATLMSPHLACARRLTASK